MNDRECTSSKKTVFRYLYCKRTITSSLNNADTKRNFTLVTLLPLKIHLIFNAVNVTNSLLTVSNRLIIASLLKSSKRNVKEKPFTWLQIQHSPLFFLKAILEIEMTELTYKFCVPL